MLFRTKIDGFSIDLVATVEKYAYFLSKFSGSSLSFDLTNEMLHGAAQQKVQISTLSNRQIGITLSGERAGKWVWHRAGEAGGMFDDMLQNVPGRIFDKTN